MFRFAIIMIFVSSLAKASQAYGSKVVLVYPPAPKPAAPAKNALTDEE